jgi:hypothetical protein
MNISKKSIKIESILLIISVVFSVSTVLVTPVSTHALSLKEAVSGLPLIGNQQNSQKPADQTPSAPQPSKEEEPEEGAVVETPTLELPVTTPSQPIIPQPTLPVQTPVQIPTPPVVASPVVAKPSTPKPKTPVVNKMTKVTPSNIQVAEMIRNTAQDTPLMQPAVAQVTATPSLQSVIMPVNRVGFVQPYVSNKISTEERNELYKVSAAIVLLGLGIYALSLKSVRSWTFGSESRTPLTANN